MTQIDSSLPEVASQLAIPYVGVCVGACVYRAGLAVTFFNDAQRGAHMNRGNDINTL